MDGADNPSARTAELFHFLRSDPGQNIDTIVKRTLAVIGGLFAVYVKTDKDGALVRSSSPLPEGLADDLLSADTCFSQVPSDDEIILIEADGGHPFPDDPIAEKYELTTLLGAVVRGTFPGILWVADTRARQFSSDRIHSIHCFAGALALQETMGQTRKKEAEKQIIGEMAGQVAHDLNNILTGLVSYPELVLMQLDSQSPLNAPVSFMHESGVTASALVQDFLLLARPQSYTPPELDPLEVIRSYFSGSAHVRMRHEYPYIDFSLDAAPGQPCIRISEILLTKLITTLLTHSASTVRGSSRIDLCLSTQNPESPPARAGHLIITVRDNGQTLSDDELKHLFEPFYTKKQMGYAGSGLGLPVVKRIMTDHNGYVTVRNIVQNRRPAGTEICLFFPLPGSRIN